MIDKSQLQREESVLLAENPPYLPVNKFVTFARGQKLKKMVVCFLLTWGFWVLQFYEFSSARQSKHWLVVKCKSNYFLCDKMPSETKSGAADTDTDTDIRGKSRFLQIPGTRWQ